MYGDKAIELIKEIDRNKDVLPPYNEELLRQILEEMKFLAQQNYNDTREAQQADEADEKNAFSENATSSLEHSHRSNVVSKALAIISPTIVFRHYCIERDRRCILAYLYNRLMRLKELRWNFGSVVPPVVRGNLCEPEIKWFQSYNQILANYMRSVGGLDLTRNTKPPKSLYIEVRCMVDYGEFETEDGKVVLLRKNTQHALLRSDCEALIRQGVLQHVI